MESDENTLSDEVAEVDIILLPIGFPEVVLGTAGGGIGSDFDEGSGFGAVGRNLDDEFAFGRIVAYACSEMKFLTGYGSQLGSDEIVLRQVATLHEGAGATVEDVQLCVVIFVRTFPLSGVSALLVRFWGFGQPPAGSSYVNVVLGKYEYAEDPFIALPVIYVE